MKRILIVLAALLILPMVSQAQDTSTSWQSVGLQSSWSEELGFSFGLATILHAKGRLYGSGSFQLADTGSTANAKAHLLLSDEGSSIIYGLNMLGVAVDMESPQTAGDLVAYASASTGIFFGVSYRKFVFVGSIDGKTNFKKDDSFKDKIQVSGAITRSFSFN